MVAIPRSAIQFAKERDCQEIAERYGWKRASGTRGGWQLYYDPRGEHKASLGIKPTGFYHFGTGEHGDSIALEQTMMGRAFAEAVEVLGGYLAAPTILPFAKPAPKHIRRVTETWQKAALAIVLQAEQYLWSDKPDALQARAYLHKRGLTDNTIKRWRLGFNPRWVETTYRKEDGSLANVAPGIVIPTFIDGEIQAVKVRKFTGDIKYIQMAGGNTAPLFGADLIRAGQPVIIVEGEFDALIGNQEAGELATFVTIGSASNTVTDITRERLEVAARIIVAPDNDTAGEGGAKRLTDALPLAMVATIPSGKDVTEFVTQGGNVRQWMSEALATSPVLTFAALPDGVRSVALNCKLEAAVIVYEVIRAAGLTTFTKMQAYAAAQRLGAGINQRMIYRGIDQGVLIVPLTKSVTTSLDKENTDYIVTDFVKKPSSRQVYTLAQLDQIKIRLRARLHYRLIERLFPARRDELPPIEADLIQAAGYDNPIEAAGQIQAIVDNFTSEAERTKVQRKIAFEQRALKRLETMLTQRKTTPIRWVAGVDFAAQYLHAIYEHDAHARSETEIGLLVGRGRQNLDNLLARAGIDSKQRQPEKIALTDPEKIEDTLTEVFRRAKGNGQIGAMRSIDDHGRGEPIPFTSASEVKSWAAAQLATGRKLEFTINLCNEQKIAGEVQPRSPRQARQPRQLEIAQNCTLSHTPHAGDTPQNPTPHTRVRVAKPLPYTGEGYDPAYARATLIKIHARSWSLSVDDPSYADITNSDLIGMIIDEPIRDDIGLTDAITTATPSADLEVVETTYNLTLVDISNEHAPAHKHTDGDGAIATPLSFHDDPFAAWLIETYGGKVAIAEHPGKALLDAYNALPEGLPRYDYHDGLTAAQRGDLIAYKHHLSGVA